MGSQVNFYMVPEDEEDFCRFVLTDPAVTILRAGHPEHPHVPISLPMPPAEQHYCGGLVLWNAEVASKEEVTPQNKVRAVGFPAGVFNINAMVYPVIDFNRSIPQSNGLAPGRIWAGFEWNSLPEERMKLFRAWFRRLAGWLNKLPYRYDMYRIGPKTKEYFDSGGKAIGFGLGDVMDIKTVGDVSVIHRGVSVDSFTPDIESDDGKDDLTIELEP